MVFSYIDNYRASEQFSTAVCIADYQKLIA